MVRGACCPRVGVSGWVAAPRHGATQGRRVHGAAGRAAGAMTPPLCVRCAVTHAPFHTHTHARTRAHTHTHTARRAHQPHQLCDDGRRAHGCVVCCCGCCDGRRRTHTHSRVPDSKCTHTHTHARTHTHTHTRTHTHTHAHTHTHTHTRTHEHSQTRPFVCCTCSPECVHACSRARQRCLVAAAGSRCAWSVPTQATPFCSRRSSHGGAPWTKSGCAVCVSVCVCVCVCVRVWHGCVAWRSRACCIATPTGPL
jgi:hypothetical protein